MAEKLGATVVKVKAKKAADGLIGFAQQEGITHVIFGQSSRTRWDILLQGSVLNRFLAEVKGAAVQVIPLSDQKRTYPDRAHLKKQCSLPEVEDSLKAEL